MKNKDIASLILVVAITLFATWLIFGSFIVTDADQSREVEVVIPIDPEFPTPSKDIFNKNSVNPTELIRIGNQNQNQKQNNNNNNN